MALFSQPVLTSEVAIAPDIVRQKLIRPAAEAISDSSTLASASPVSGTKNKGKPMPCNNNGQPIWKLLMSVLPKLRHKVTAPSQVTPMKTSLRGSILTDILATNGAVITARIPLKAVVSPEWVAV